MRYQNMMYNQVFHLEFWIARLIYFSIERKRVSKVNRYVEIELLSTYKEGRYFENCRQLLFVSEKREEN